MNVITELLNHQKDAVLKLMSSKVGALFMEMGTGKTRTAFELIYRRKNKISNIVWFCPVSLKKTIFNEIKKHTDLKDDDIYIFDSKTNFKNIPNKLFYVVGIQSMSSSKRVLSSCYKIINEKSYIVVDESSFIKGYKSLRTKWIINLTKECIYKLILTGTPISQGIIDIYSQMMFLSPKILGYRSFYSFAANHIEYSEKYKNMIVRTFNEDFIANKIKPYIYQITKKECINLPDKIYKQYYFDMTMEQEYMYEKVKNNIIDSWKDEFSGYDIFKLLSSLQQIVSGYYKDNKNNKFYEVNHNRSNILRDIINNIENNQKIIIWCKFEYDIHQITELLVNEYGYDSFVTYYGKLNESIRNNNVNTWKNNDNCRFFIATQSCGGFGLTLNESNYVIFYNNEFNYGNRLQAEDRCHRIGQKNNVTYIDICCNAKIDIKILDNMNKKSYIVNEFKKEIDKVKDFKKLKEKIRNDL